eukprot:maker-scaffold_4-snap-gene-14.4-mRNA-1 protein AED:0.17 eAED:0.17 QI:0/0/0/1/1/1/2/0/291
MKESIVIQTSSAAAGAAISTLSFYPLELIKTILQASVSPDSASSEEDLSSAAKVIAHVYKLHGLLGFFHVLFRSVVTDSLFFLNSTFIKGKALEYNDQKKLSVTKEISFNFVAACLTQLIGHPLDAISTAIVIDDDNKPASVVLQDLVRTNGLVSLWTGYFSSMILGLNPSLQFTLFDRVKKIYGKFKEREPSSYELFLLGMLTKCITLCVIYPLIRSKIRMQAQLKEHVLNPGMLSAAKEIFSHEGAFGFYKGLREQLLKSMLSTALLLTVKEKIALLISRLANNHLDEE